jgi:glycogen(starch) synthase
MNVLMTTDTVGGVWHYCLDLIRVLTRFDIHVDLATMGRPLDQNQIFEISQIPKLRVHESSYKLEWMENCWDDVLDAGDWLQDLAHNLQPDLIHFNHFCSAHLNFSQPKIVVVHSDVISWWRHVHHVEAPENWNEYRQRVRLGLRSADLVIAPSKAMLESAENDFGSFKKSKVIPNGRSMPISSNDLGSGVLKEPFILTAGRIWDEAKNIQSLDEIAPQLSWPIVAAGRVDDVGIKKSGIKNLNLVGQLSAEKMSSFFAKASIYALPAKYEPFGLSILEAAQNECALVLGDIPSLRENWNEAAIFVNPFDSKEISQALELLIRDADLRNDFAKRAREKSEKFNIESTAMAYLNEYRRLLKSRLYASQDQCMAVSI